MRAPADPERVREFMVEFARRVKGPGRVYLTGGATAILRGFRAMTKDIDLSFAPEPHGTAEALRELKDLLDINVEPAAPADFIPPLPGWQDRSLFIARHGSVDFFDYDPYSQVLAKVERGHARDLDDAHSFVSSGLVDPTRLRALFANVREGLVSDSAYVAIDPEAFEQKVDGFLASLGRHDDA